MTQDNQNSAGNLDNTENTQRQPALDLRGAPPPAAQPANGSAARILAVGVGGAGTNAINHMIQVGVSGVEFVAMNTDAQALEQARTPARLRLGETLTRGLGAGGNPTIGQQAAQESYNAIREQLRGANMVFITAGMGGGTGTGASPLVAQAAHEEGALTVAIVTTPFAFERRRKQIAADGVEALREVVDALIVVPNERLMELSSRDLGAFEAYRLADDVLRQGIQGISDLITIPGLINLDFADIRSVMSDTGSALMAMSRASGEQRAEQAAHDALTNPLLDVDIRGARNVIFNITGGDDLTMAEVHQIADIIEGAAHPDANIIFGTVHDASLDGAIKLTVVATGFEPRVIHPEFPSAPRATGRGEQRRPAQITQAAWPEQQRPPWVVRNDQPSQSPQSPQSSRPAQQRAAQPQPAPPIPPAEQRQEFWDQDLEEDDWGQPGVPPADQRRGRYRPLPPMPGSSDEELRVRRLEQLRAQRRAHELRELREQSSGQHQRPEHAGHQSQQEPQEEYLAGEDAEHSQHQRKRRLFCRR